MAKYTPLAEHLEALPPEKQSVTLTFSDIDRLVGGLPPTANTAFRAQAPEQSDRAVR